VRLLIWQWDLGCLTLPVVTVSLDYLYAHPVQADKQLVVNVVSFGEVPLSSVLLSRTSAYQSTRTGE
jgi:hypothetical protein